ncbi:MAG: hypothetical protein UGF45_09930 [Massilioclostridium sp.]|nr:hypothetical protein [Massilioclostridium sp.]MEE1492302.1 hypothetical protein [Massilioclostridium sp.]
MSNGLVPKSALDITPVEEQAQKAEILDTLEDESLLELRKQRLAQRSKRVGIDTKENNLAAVETLNGQIQDIIELVSNPEIVKELIPKMKSPKDYNELVKATAALVSVRDKQLDKTLDEFASATGKRRKIDIAFAAQGVKVAARIETGDD